MFVIARHTVTNVSEPVRLYDYCTTVFKEYIPSRKGIKKALKRGEFYVDGHRGNSGDWINEGQVIELYDLELNPPKPYDLPLDVVMEDDHMAVILKPAGIPVSGNQYRTVQNAIIGQIGESHEKDALKWPRPVHRLDSPTSGLLIIAKTARAITGLSEQFRERKIEKTYMAVVMGIPPKRGEITSAVGGMEAKSTVSTFQTVPSLQSGSLSLVQLHPHTGRTHQLRIHCAESGFPILGDTQYGPKGNTLLHKGLFLCATQLRFNHPITGKKMEVDIATPAKFLNRMNMEAKRWEKFNHDAS